MKFKLKWLKELALDIIITIIIVIGSVYNLQAIRIFLFIYTPLILIAKILALTTADKKKRFKNIAPTWIYHTLYALNIVFLILCHWWILTVGWALVWLFSYLYIRK